MEANNTTKIKHEYICRYMEMRDVDAVHEIEVEAFTLPWSRAAFVSELLDNRMAKYFVVENSEGYIVAYAGMWFVLDEAHITTIAVRKSSRGLGLGNLLVERIIAETLALGGTQLTLEVRVSNAAAIAMYEKFGFKVHGLRKKYYSDNQEDALIMWAVIDGDE
ncbi:ribosomal protein S18-alanine N-acetyltransferase [Desulfuribacillus alkaliarsenatis]|uniref:Ribosomal-protein-alanine N-acetyltransferase n=1 Tax=Desulfuribacillus alkaliarsenatis TaxID=766136 RepID=A0A1E5G1V9_9FIRM|nr:ribosomal protein S18-alanine N-acetyltransferase [Desulfuribacillus alkaliarsenatis]OEF96965.1 ribosomal-protein-alanine N-acetyltransferase [Desulfuribacillus alkaliarsenatis]